MLAYRSTPHPEVGDTPFFLNKGYDPLIPEMLALDAPIKKHRAEGEWLQELQRARASLEEKIAVEQQRIAEMIQESNETQISTRTSGSCSENSGRVTNRSYEAYG